jgi:16S rRNA (guanine527-N7)-methyltransferase
MNAVADDAAVTRRLAALGARHGLSAGQLGQLRCLLEIVGTDPHVPTAVTTPREAVDVHLADSLAALDLEPLRVAARIVDIGSGAGFPGLPLAVALPGVELRLLESSARRCAFIERACSAAGVHNATAVATRVEAWDREDREQDVVTARAVAPLAVLCEYAAPLLRVGGALVVWRGHRDGDAEQAAARAAALLGLEAREPVRSEPYPGSQEHHLHVYVKVGPTPARFPRRPGIASKRPLGVST